APIANRISVVVGLSETMRRGSLPLARAPTVSPKSSTLATRGRDLRVDDPHATAAATQIATSAAHARRRAKRKTDIASGGNDVRKPMRRCAHGVCATSPPPRTCCCVARTTSRLLAPGRVARLPDRSIDQWRVERAYVPVTVAGPRRPCTGFRGSRPQIQLSREG